MHYVEDRLFTIPFEDLAKCTQLGDLLRNCEIGRPAVLLSMYEATREIHKTIIASQYNMFDRPSKQTVDCKRTVDPLTMTQHAFSCLIATRRLLHAEDFIAI